MFSQGEHGLASIFTDPNIPCYRSTENRGECACDGTSYFPVLQKKPYPCGSNKNSNMNITVKHPKNKLVVACNDCVGPDRLSCLDGNTCFCDSDCSNNTICDKLNNRCVKNAKDYTHVTQNIIQKSQPSQFIYNQENNNNNNTMKIVIGVIIVILILILFFYYFFK